MTLKRRAVIGLRGAPRMVIETVSGEAIVLAAASLYLVLGNLPRVLSLPGVTQSVPITEVALYGVAVAYLATHGPARAVVRIVLPVVAIFVCSFVIGVVTQGPALKPALYLVRLVLLLASGACIAHVVVRRAHGQLERVFRLVLLPFVGTAALGFAILAVFPGSATLWAFLASIGIVYQGDPHIGRFVSPYLDPNYYAAIAVLPLMLAMTLWRIKRNLLYLACASIFIASILLTSSRSGTATLVLVGVIILITEARGRHLSLQVRPRTLLAGVAVAVVLSPVYLRPMIAVAERFGAISSDPSALARLDSMRYGIGVLAENPVTGLGFNYLSLRTEEAFGLSSVDSSMLATLINLGVPFTILLLVAVARRAVLIRTRMAGWNAASRWPYTWFLAYVLVVATTGSLFNNILYYQFWLLPVVVLWISFDILSREATRDPGTPIRMERV